MILHPESHTDHHLTPDQVDYILTRFREREAFFIETVELPEELGTVMCGLHGPAMGDAPVEDWEVTYAVRGGRAGPSRLCDRPIRQTRLLTVIAGPHEEPCAFCRGTGWGERGSLPIRCNCTDGKVSHACILYTAYGGASAPREPWDPSLDEAGKAESVAFWATHALSR